jgi:thioredoxin reductase (NADPH)
MSIVETRAHQLFPLLDPAQVETARRFASGPARNFAPGEIVFDVGERNIPIWLVLEGSIQVMRRDGLKHEAAITTLREGQFSGEVSQLAEQGTLALGRAGEEGCTAVPLDAAHVRALMIGSAEIGEIMMRAFILRRVGLIEMGASDRCSWAPRARQLSLGLKVSCSGTATRLESSMPKTATTAERSWSALGCFRMSCRS